MSEIELPWTKQEIIDTVRHAFDNPPRLPNGTYLGSVVTQVAWHVLVFKEDRAAPYIEHALFQRIERVRMALQEGRDPEVAFDVPLDIERPLTPQVQLSAGYRRCEQMHSEMER
jgi:hypothetical protein